MMLVTASRAPILISDFPRSGSKILQSGVCGVAISAIQFDFPRQVIVDYLSYPVLLTKIEEDDLDALQLLARGGMSYVHG